MVGLGAAGEVGERQQQLGLRARQLLVVRLAPVALCAVAEPAALDAVEQRGTHRAEAEADVAQRLRVAVAALAVEQQAQGGGVRELRRVVRRRGAREAAEVLVEGAVDRSADLGDELRRERPAPRVSALAMGARLDDLRRDRLAADVPGLVDAIQQLEQRLGREVGDGGEALAVAVQQRHGRPAAGVVAGVEVRPHIGVDADGDEAAAHELDDPRVGVAGLVHHVAPVAPDGGDREQQRLVLGAGALEGLGAPLEPGDLVGAVGAGGEAVRAAVRRMLRHGRPPRSLA